MTQKKIRFKESKKWVKVGRGVINDSKKFGHHLCMINVENVMFLSTTFISPGK